MDQSRLAFMALHFVPGIGDHLIKQLVSYCGSPEKFFNTPKGKLKQIPGIGDTVANSIHAGHVFDKAENELRLASQTGVDIVCYTDKAYPSRLKTVDDSPSMLYAKGKMNLENKKTVAIIGTRNATIYGKECVERIIEGLVKHNPVIVSGLAYGIDIMAHREALKQGIETVGILGSGIDTIYPGSHSQTALEMQANGGLISEFPFGTKPESHRFPTRNRIIAGLVDALIVVEAGASGGALITAEIGNSYNRDVFAFPGNITQSYSIGCNNLIKSNKAHLMTGIEDLEYIMGWIPQQKSQPEDSIHLFEGCSEDEQTIVKSLIANGGTMLMDELSWKSGIAVSKLASLLLNLEFQGRVQSLPGKIFRLRHKAKI